jgi:Domain of unknown function (DUF3943)
MRVVIALIALLASAPGFAQSDSRTATDSQAAPQGPTAFAARQPTPVAGWGVGDGRSFAVPAFEIAGYEFLLNRFDHYAIDDLTYESPITDFRHNVGHKWVVDNDKFSTNQFLHPYQGAMYQAFARSAGLNFWQSAAYTLAGSLLWEEAGETTWPSINDQVATGVGGLFFGEPLFRMASLLLESGPDGSPGAWREWLAAAISPATGFNRLAFGDRFRGVFASDDPAVFTRLDVGYSLSPHFSSNVNVNADLTAPPTFQTYKRNEGSVDFTMSYGLPGKPGYAYERPFDYFDFQFIASTANIFESIFSRGLLYGTSYGVGDDYRGIWGLYGSYDYVAPQVFRVSSTALSLGTTAQWWLSKSIALQGSALAGLGYAGGGVIHGAGVESASPLGDGQRDYHYGITPQALATLRVMFGDRLLIDAAFREYYISRVGATESTGSERISRGDVALTLRVYGLNGLTIRYSESNRVGTYASLPTSRQTLGTVSLGYTLLGQSHLGAVDWRRAADTE